MRILRRLLLKLSRRRRFEQDFEAEIAFHRDLAREQGNPVGLGHVGRIQEEARDLWRFTLLEDLWRDLAYALRFLQRSPGFTIVAILTLALGIGANTAIFTLLHRVMLASMPVREPGQLIELLSSRGNGPPGNAFSYQALQDFRKHTQVCSSILAFSNTVFHTLVEGKAMERLNGQYVSGDYFSDLDVGVVRGRPILPEDDRVGAPTVAVISYSLWKTRFGGSSDAIGKTVALENVPFTVIGVAPPDFQGLEVGRQFDIWVPLESERETRRPSYTSSPGYKWLLLVGRLKADATLEQARSELQVLYSRTVLEHEIAELLHDPLFEPSAARFIRTWSLTVEPAGAGLSRTRREYSTPLYVLMAIVGALLLIACTNVANLLFARALAREKEIALRLSLGAGRSRVIRQLLTESAVLVTAGGTLGLLTAYLLCKYLATFLAGDNPPLVFDVSPNLVTLGFTAGVAVLAVVLFGLAPAFRSTDMDFANRLKGNAPGSHGGASHRWSRGLIVLQVSLLMVLIFGAGLFLRTIHNLNSIDLGFDRSNVLLVVVDPFGTGHSLDRLKALAAESLEKLEALPGIRTASLARFAPISGGSGINLSFGIDREAGGPIVARNVFVNIVGTKYFALLGIPVIAGREFVPQDTTSPRRVVVVNQAFVRRYFGQTTPIGRTITQQNTPMEIVGVVGDAKYSEIRESVQPTVYYDVFQQFGTPMQFLIRTDGDPRISVDSVRAEVRSMFGNVAIRERTLNDQIDASIVRERLVSSLAGIFGGLALSLAVIGLYGVVSNSVARRTREIGIRIALGFDRRAAVSMVLREVFVLVGAGVVLGLPVAVVVTRSLSGMFFGLPPDDPATVLASVGALMLSALTAGIVPARRASRVDPIVALRTE